MYHCGMCMCMCGGVYNVIIHMRVYSTILAFTCIQYSINFAILLF